MDSKTVNKSIREIIRPVLQEHGFSHFTERNSWRFNDNRIDVINFQSFNTYMADGLGCTTYSFAVNIGCYHKALPLIRHGNIKRNSDDELLPEEFRCPFRASLLRSIEQWLPGIIPRKFKRPEIWYISPEGEYLSAALEDALKQIEDIALPWFACLHDDHFILDLLQHKDEDMIELWGFGANPSPMRSYLTGYFAMYMGNNELAKTYLDAVLNADTFEDEKEMIKNDIRNLN